MMTTSCEGKLSERIGMARGVRGFSSAALRNARQAERLTLRQLAQELRVSPMTVTRWESGASLPTAYHLAEIGRVLDRDPADFVHSGTGIRLRRNLAGLTMRDAATQSGLARSTISHLEHGHTVRATTATLEALARVYGCTVEDVLSDVAATRDALDLEIAARQAARSARR